MSTRPFRVGVAAACTLLPLSVRGDSAGALLLSDDFAQRPPGLISNAFAYHHPSDPQARKDTIWEVTAGSFFADRGSGFSGVPDSVQPNALSTNGSGSAMLRVRSQRANFNNVSVSFDLQTVAFFDHTGIAPNGHDGVGAVLREKSTSEFYVALANSRDDNAAIVRLMPGKGPNGIRATELATAHFPTRRNAVQHVQVSVQTLRDGSVLLVLMVDGERVARARDDGRIGGPPIFGDGRIGFYGDNAEFYVRRFALHDLPTH